jgi:ribonucleoside-diphosphate reductase alpha subunit
MDTLYITKRDGRKESVLFDKISARIEKLCYGLDSNYVDHIAIAQKVVGGIYPAVTTAELDELAAQTAANMATIHPDFGLLAGRIAVSRLHKVTKNSFSETMTDLFDHGLIADDVCKVVILNSEVLDSAIDNNKDFTYDYFGYKTLEKSYLLKIDGKIVETPQYLLMRVAVGIHKDDIESVLETYRGLSDKDFIHATPTLFNAGTVKNQLSSCFLLAMKDDSIEGIFDTLKQCAIVSKYAGGIGLSVSNIRGKGAYIAGTGGTSNGLVPMLQTFNAAARYVDQGGGKRKGSFAIYLEPWHNGVVEFLDLKKNHGNELDRARDIFLSLFVNDIFMRRVEKDGDWTLMCPSKAPDLIDLHGDAFDKAYKKYEQDGIGKTINARYLWGLILQSQIETGVPYMVYKDAANAKSNQKNLGTIRSSNLCCEIIQYTSKEEVAVCNLASINLLRHVKDDQTFDFEKLHDTAKQVTRNLNRVIDVNYYALEEARTSNMKHRPIAVGVQALADVFMVLGLPFESEEAGALNARIFQTIYHGCIEASIELAEKDGAYASFPGSPASKGQLQFDLWGVDVDNSIFDWTKTKANMAKHGLRNSLLVAQMPTASSAIFCSGGVESIEAITSLLYNRRCIAGEFVVICRHLVNDLVKLGLWDLNMKDQVMRGGGSIQHIQEIPKKIREVYKTVWEISQKTVLDQAVARGPFICQSVSQNAFFESPTVSKLSSYHFYGWRGGLVTGQYYLRSRPVADALKFTVPSEASVEEEEEECVNCSA